MGRDLEIFFSLQALPHAKLYEALLKRIKVTKLHWRYVERHVRIYDRSPRVAQPGFGHVFWAQFARDRHTQPDFLLGFTPLLNTDDFGWSRGDFLIFMRWPR